MKRALLLALALGCGSKSSPPTAQMKPPLPSDTPADAGIASPDPAPATADGAALDRDLARLAQRSVALYADVAATFRAAGANCATATQKLGELRTRYADVTAANTKVLHEGRARELKAALVKYDEQLDAAAKEIVGSQTMSTCTKDRAFTRAFDDLVGAPP